MHCDCPPVKRFPACCGGHAWRRGALSDAGFLFENFIFVLPVASVMAQTPRLEMNVMYECPPPYSFKFLSCSGTNLNDWCDVQSYRGRRPFQRGNRRTHR